MDLNWIEDFCTLAEVNSFSQAARLRHITQSAFSKRIRSLENVLGGELVDRNHQPLRLTRLGTQFLKDCGPLLEAVHKARDNASHIAGEERFNLTFSGANTLAQSFFPAWITRKKALAAGVVPQMLSSRTAAEDVEGLMRGDIDFYLTYYHPSLPLLFDVPDFTYKQLGTETLVPVCRSLGEGKSQYDLDSGSPDSIPYIGRLKGSYIGALVDELITRWSPSIVRAYEGANGENLVGLLVHGGGVGWMPYNRVKDDLERGVLDICGGSTWQIEIEVRIYRRKGPTRREVDNFWRTIEDDNSEFPCLSTEMNVYSAAPQMQP